MCYGLADLTLNFVGGELKMFISLNIMVFELADRRHLFS